MTRGHHQRHGHPLLDRNDEIQFLAPRTDLFAGGSDLHDVTPAGAARAFADIDDTGDDPRRPRWITIGAGLGLVALIAVGVIAAAPWHDDATTAAPVTVPPGLHPTAPTVSTPRPVPVLTPATLSPENAAVVHDAFLVDPARLPAGMTALPANMPTDGADDTLTIGDDAPAGWMELWATPGATRTTGSWYAIGWSPMRDMMTADGAARITVRGDETGLLATAADGVSTLVFERDSGTATLTWFGRSAEEMTALAGQFRFTSIGRPVYPHVWTPGSLLRVVGQESAGRDLAADYGSLGSTSNAGYQFGAARYIGITTFPIDPTHEAMRPFVIVATPDDATSGPSTARTVDGRSVVVGRLTLDQWAGAAPNNVVEWSDGDQTVMLGGNVDVPTLLALVPLIRRGTSGEWWEMSSMPWPDKAPQVAAGRADATPAMLGYGDLPDGDQWYLDIDAAGRIADFSASGTADGNGIYLGIDLAAGPCAVESNLDSTVVVCVRPVSEGLEMVHIEGDRSTRDISLSTRDPGGSYTFAVAQFTEPGSFRVDIIGADGRTLRALSVGVVDGA